jgi:hypothetical protein
MPPSLIKIRHDVTVNKYWWRKSPSISIDNKKQDVTAQQRRSVK